MKKGNLKQFFKANCWVFAFGIWLFLISGTIIYLFEGRSIGTKITPLAVSVIYTIVGIAMMVKAGAKLEKQKAEAKEKRLLELEEQYKYYIDLVNTQVQEKLNKIKKEFLSAFEINANLNLEYLISFDDYKEWICRNRIIGKPDSFIIASCLIYSLIDHPIITIKETEEIAELETLKFIINLGIAMGCAFKIIAEPSTYYQDGIFWVEEKHPKVNIVVPSGLIKNSDLYQRIITAIYYDDVGDKRTSIMQFANLLHLIYLNCQ